jgi:hypothetical protein
VFIVARPEACDASLSHDADPVNFDLIMLPEGKDIIHDSDDRLDIVKPSLSNARILETFNPAKSKKTKGAVR